MGEVDRIGAFAVDGISAGNDGKLRDGTANAGSVGAAVARANPGGVFRGEGATAADKPTSPVRTLDTAFATDGDGLAKTGDVGAGVAIGDEDAVTADKPGPVLCTPEAAGATVGAGVPGASGTPLSNDQTLAVPAPCGMGSGCSVAIAGKAARAPISPSAPSLIPTAMLRIWVVEPPPK